MTKQVDLHTLHLMSSKIFHDLAGPITAINSATELMEMVDDKTLDDEVFKLLKRSSQEATRKLTFFRVAFGFGGGVNQLKSNELITVIDDFFYLSRVTLVWEEVPPSISNLSAKVLAVFLLLTSEALPNGGKIIICINSLGNGLGIACQGIGEAGKLNLEAIKILTEQSDISEFTARTIIVKYLQLLLIETGAQLEVNLDDPDQLSLAALIP